MDHTLRSNVVELLGNVVGLFKLDDHTFTVDHIYSVVYFFPLVLLGCLGVGKKKTESKSLSWM